MLYCHLPGNWESWLLLEVKLAKCIKGVYKILHSVRLDCKHGEDHEGASLRDTSTMGYMVAKKHFEVNRDHSIVTTLHFDISQSAPKFYMLFKEFSVSSREPEATRGGRQGLQVSEGPGHAPI